jgi:hypothetical protein
MPYPDDISSGEITPRSSSRGISLRDRLLARTGRQAELTDTEPRTRQATTTTVQGDDTVAGVLERTRTTITGSLEVAAESVASQPEAVDIETFPRSSFPSHFDLRDQQSMDTFRNRLFNTGTAAGIPVQTVPASREKPASAATRRSSTPKDPSSLMGSAFRSTNFRSELERERFAESHNLGPERTSEMPHDVPETEQHWTQIEEHGLSFSSVADPGVSLYQTPAYAAAEVAAPDSSYQFDIRDALSDDDSYPDMTIQLAPGLSRACATCRDFRPDEHGNRGRCMNTWAFTYQQTVDGSDLACQSTIGCWWLPFDAVWKPGPRDDMPTPRVARLITGDERRRSG